jgi:hypothetical protein
LPITLFLLGGNTRRPVDLSQLDKGSTAWEIRRDTIPEALDLVPRYNTEISYAYRESDEASYGFHYLGTDYTDDRRPKQSFYLNRISNSIGKRRSVTSVHIEMDENGEGYTMECIITEKGDTTTRQNFHVGKDGKIAPAESQPVMM